MFRLLGILSLLDLLTGGRHHRRALRRGLFLGAVLGYFANRHFDMDRAAEDIRTTVRETRRTVREAVHAARREMHATRKAEHRRQVEERLAELRKEAEARRAARENRHAETATVIRALPESGTREAREIRDLADDLERDARTAAMAVDVPTLQFPEEEAEKYHSSRKYGYA